MVYASLTAVQNLNLLLTSLTSNMHFAVNVENWALGSLVAAVCNTSPDLDTRAAAVHIMNGMVTCVSGEAPVKEEDVEDDNDDPNNNTIFNSPIYLDNVTSIGNGEDEYIIDYEEEGGDDGDQGYDNNNLSWDITGRSQREFRFLSVAASRVAAATHACVVYNIAKDDVDALSGNNNNNNDDRSFFYDYPPAGGGYLNEVSCDRCVSANTFLVKLTPYCARS